MARGKSLGAVPEQSTRNQNGCDFSLRQLQKREHSAKEKQKREQHFRGYRNPLGRVFYLSHKLRRCKKIFGLEKSHNSEREEMR